MQNPRNTVDIDRSILNKPQYKLPDASYRERIGINASGLKDILTSPGHYRYHSLHPKEPTPAMLLGTLTHLAVLEPDKFAEVAKRTVGTKSYALEDETKVSIDAYEKAKVMAASVMANPQAARLLSRGHAEVSLWWTDPVEDVICKGKVDFISHAFKGGPVAIDLKTAADITPAGFARACVNNRYDMQAAHYCAGGEESGAFRADKFVFIAVENSPPYFCTVHIADPSVLNLGHQWRAYAMEVYNLCRKSQTWNAVETNRLILPGFAKTPQQAMEYGELPKPQTPTTEVDNA